MYIAGLWSLIRGIYPRLFPLKRPHFGAKCSWILGLSIYENITYRRGVCLRP